MVVGFGVEDGYPRPPKRNSWGGGDLPLIQNNTAMGERAGHNIAGYHYDPDRVIVELYTEMAQFIPELGFHEPSPWHEHLPMRPKTWQLTELNAWGAEFSFNLATG